MILNTNQWLNSVSGGFEDRITRSPNYPMFVEVGVPRSSREPVMSSNEVKLLFSHVNIEKIDDKCHVSFETVLFCLFCNFVLLDVEYFE